VEVAIPEHAVGCRYGRQGPYKPLAQALDRLRDRYAVQGQLRRFRAFQAFELETQSSMVLAELLAQLDAPHLRRQARHQQRALECTPPGSRQAQPPYGITARR